MLQIPIQAVAAQMVSVVLANQDCQISLYQKGAELFLDLVANERNIVSTRLVRNAVPLIRQPYLGFVGDLMLMDMQSNRDPEYQGLGERYRLYYIEANDLATQI